MTPELAVVLRTLRTARGMSQYQLAKRCGIDPSYINRLEGGERVSPSLDTLRKVARHLELTNGEIRRLGYAALVTDQPREWRRGGSLIARKGVRPGEHA